MKAVKSARLEPSPAPLAPIQSTAGSGSTPVSVDTEAFKPFALKRRWYCPYRLKGLPCVHRKKNGLQPGEFNSFQALCQHTDKAHDGGKQVVTPVEMDPLPDGTKKIPCIKKCGAMFTSYQQANQHSQLKYKDPGSSNPTKKPRGCSMPNRTNIPCVWRNIVGCTSLPAENADSYANHHRTHVRDMRGPYTCQKNCGEYHACLYMLQSHEEDCEGPAPPTRPVTMRFDLGSTPPTTPPDVIVIGRASASPPKSWAMGTANIKQGLPTWGDQIVRHLAVWRGAKPSAVVLHASPFVRTRYMPAPSYDSSTAEEKEDLRWHVRRAFYFTKAILADIKKANIAGITPTLLSVGLDGFTCNRKALSAWLEVNEDIDFEVVFRFRSLNYGMQEEHVDVHANVYWAAFSSDALRKALNGDQSDQRLVQVLESMDKLQGIKDAMTGENSLKNGRNGVDTNFVFPDWQ